MAKIIRAVTISMSCIFFKDIMKGMQRKGHEMIALTSPGPELCEFAKEGFKTIEITMERHISLNKDFKSLCQLIRVFRSERPLIVHSMTPKAGLLCMIAAWITKVPFRIHTFTGLVWPTERGLRRRILKTTDWLTCACATHIIPEGKGVMDDLRQGGITKKPMRVLGYGNVRGVDLKHFDPARCEKKDGFGVFAFLFVGRIVGDKGINELVEAFVKLSSKFPKTELKLVGNYEEELNPVHEITKQIITDNPKIKFLGPKFGNDLVQVYADADCFVMPSYREGFPNTVIEAGAMGLPCIVTDINGSREIINDGENGLVVPSKDTESLYLAMEHMLQDIPMRESMAAKARPMIASRFDKDFVQKCQIDFYEEILGNVN